MAIESTEAGDRAAGLIVPSAPGRGVTWRAILLGLALIPFNCWWVGTVEGVWHGLHFTCLSLAMNAVFLLLACVVLNALFVRACPKLALSQAELLTLFSMLALSSVLCGEKKNEDETKNEAVGFEPGHPPD